VCRVVGGDGERSRKWSEAVGMAAHRTVLAETWMWRRMSMVIKEGWCDGIDSQLFLLDGGVVISSRAVG
jgi:hypothetical protein